MPQSREPVNAGRKIVWLGIAVAAVCLIYTAGWFYAANKGRAWLETALKGANGGGMGQCDGMEIDGFPFRAGVFCTATAFSEPSRGVDLQTGALRTMAMVYNPQKVVFELDGPAKAKLADGTALNAVWSNLRGSLHAGLDGLHQLSMEVDGITTEATLPFPGESGSLTTGHAEFHTRRNSNDLDVAILANDNQAKIALLNAPLPTFSASIDATLEGFAGLLQGHTPAPGEIHGTIRRLVIDLGQENGRLTLSGPFSLSRDGYLSGEFDLSAENVGKLQPLLDASFPDAAPTIDASALLLQSLSKDGANASVRLTVRSGAILLGVIPLGFIPPL